MMKGGSSALNKKDNKETLRIYKNYLQCTQNQNSEEGEDVNMESPNDQEAAGEQK